MGVPTSKVGYTTATTGRGDHEVHKGHVAALGGKKLNLNTLTYLLTPYSTVLLEKLTNFQLVKKFPTFYETRRLITSLTSGRYLSLS
jgi:hypothetical protein